MIESNRSFTPSTDALVRVIGDESVVLDMASGNYLGMNPVGTRVWQLIAEGVNIDAAVETLMGEFDVAEPQLRTDIERFVGQLLELKLVA